MLSFAPLPALLGGGLIGLAASLFLFTTGRVAGISGVVVGLFSPQRGDIAWRAAFVVGLVVVGIIVAVASPQGLPVVLTRSTPAMIGGGLLVGFGTALGNGCTSGHGVCGLSRFSPRSLVATLTFMGAGVATVTAVRLVCGGTL